MSKYEHGDMVNFIGFPEDVYRVSYINSNGTRDLSPVDGAGYTIEYVPEKYLERAKVPYQFGDRFRRKATGDELVVVDVLENEEYILYVAASKPLFHAYRNSLDANFERIDNV